VKRYTFKYSAELSRRGTVHRPVAHVHLQSKDGVWYLFYPYVDSGADFPRTHSVRALLEILSDLAPEEKKPSMRSMLNNYLFELGMLEDAYITSRYVPREFKKEEAERLMKLVKEVMKNVT